MRISENFIMRDIAGEKVVVPVGEAAQMNALITMNSVAAFLWECLQEERTEEEIKAKVLEEYEVDEATAERDVRGFLDALRHFGMLEES